MEGHIKKFQYRIVQISIRKFDIEGIKKHGTFENMDWPNYEINRSIYIGTKIVQKYFSILGIYFQI